MIKFILKIFLLVLISLSLYAENETLDAKLTQLIKYDSVGPNSIGYIKIGDRSTEISQSTWIYVKKALDYYKEQRPIFIILELNTPGGEVFAAQKISDAFKDMDTQFDIPIVVFINNWAISAGAMIAYSGRFITIVKDASMGAAEPIVASETGEMKTASEKVNSALRADFANRAGFFDRNPDIAEAMVDKDIILVFRGGKIVRLDGENQINTTVKPFDIIISQKGKLLTLKSEELIKYGVADLLLPPKKLEQITQEEINLGTWPATKELLFTYPFFEKIPNAKIDKYQMDWKTKFFSFLTLPMVSSILLLGLMVGTYMEFSTPGFGLPGTLALTCLILLALANFALDVANFLEIILLLVGVAMLLVELFVLPSFGIFGLIGFVFFLAGLITMMLPEIGSVDYEFDTKTFNAAGESLLHRLTWIAGTIVIGTGLIALLARFVVPKIGFLNRFVLAGDEQDASGGYIASFEASQLPLPGTKGVAATEFRPSGKVYIDGTYYDAVSEDELIEKDTKIIVSRIDGSLLYVVKEGR